jgi:amino acid transporter
VAELDERRPERGRRPGERIVRIVRPKDFRLTRTGRYESTEHALEPEGPAGRFVQGLRRFFFGRPIRTEADVFERVSKTTGLALFASDNISSSAYATEEIMRILVFAGVAALNLTEPITLAVIAILAVVVLSELRVIRAYPQGGGSYQVARENLGMLPGLVAGAALLIDYTLTIAVSVAAGVAALSSAFPAIHQDRVLWALGIIALLTFVNLRGVRESGLIFSAPTYIYLLALFGLIGYGVFLALTSGLPPYSAPAGWYAEASFEPLTALLVLRAFSSGAVGLTGTEAIGNSVPAFKRPEVRNAGITLVAMGTCFALIFGGLSFIAGAMNVVPDPDEVETVNSQITRTLVGQGPFYYLVQGATAVLLLLAANTSFSGFPRLASILARDRFMPRQFAYRGDRLAYSLGIVVVAGLSMFILAWFGGSVTALIPLYTIGVFAAFTLSQVGLVRRWRRLRGPNWRLSMVINVVGALVTGTVAIIVAVTKFWDGAWMVLVAMPLIVAALYGIYRHYRVVEDALVIDAAEKLALETVQPIVVVPVSRLDRSALRALAFARGLSTDVRAVHFDDDETEARALEERMKVLVPEIRLQTIISPYRALLPPLEDYLDALDKGDPKRPITVILAEFVPRRWWEYLLHNQTALRIKLHLFFRPNTIVVDVPYHLGAERDR